MLTTGACVALGLVYTTETCADLYVPTLQGPEMHLAVSGQQELMLVWTGLHQMGLSCTWACLHYRGLCCTWSGLYHKVLSCTKTCLETTGVAPGLDWTKGVCTVPECVYIQYRGLSWTWICLHYICMCGNWTCPHLEGPKLHLDPRLHISGLWVKIGFFKLSHFEELDASCIGLEGKTFIQKFMKFSLNWNSFLIFDTEKSPTFKFCHTNFCENL
jgi:hypothetical protein